MTPIKKSKTRFKFRFSRINPRTSRVFREKKCHKQGKFHVADIQFSLISKWRDNSRIKQEIIG